MTSIAVHSNTFFVEDRSWVFGLVGPTDVISLTLDVSAFNLALYTGMPAGQGYIPSGVVLGVLPSGLYVPYNDAAAAGTGPEVAKCILFNTVKVPDLAVLTIDIGSAGLIRGSVARLRLPVGHGLNPAAEVDLKHIDFADRY